jgi:hypothetical protein
VACLLPLAGRLSAVTSRVALLGAGTLKEVEGTSVEVGALGLVFPLSVSLRVATQGVKPRE